MAIIKSTTFKYRPKSLIIMLSEEQIKEIRHELDTSVRPLFLFHDDPDGLCSFLSFYKYVGDGHGITLKTSAEIDPQMASKVTEYHADKVFILDKPTVGQDFLDKISVPVIWIDHHPIQNLKKVKYFNPRTNDPDINMPVSAICHMVTEQNLWIGMVGSCADWVVPPFIDEVKEKYPDLIGKDQTKPDDILFNSKFGKLARIFSFALKGKMDDVKKSIKILTRIKTPYELLNQETPQAKFVYKRYSFIEKQYQDILKSAIDNVTDDKILFYLYDQDRISLNQDLSNELLYRYPDKVIIVARKKGDEMKLSLRTTEYNLPPMINKALVGCEGYGGGHERASGANVKERDFERFLAQFKEQIK